MLDADRPTVPADLAASQVRYHGEAGRAWVAGLPELAASFLQRWQLRPDGAPRAGAAALVLPVRRDDGEPAVLKLRPVDDETVGEPAALGAWDGRGAVSLLAYDPKTGTMLLERLDAGRTLSSVPDDLTALRVLSELLARLVMAPPPAGLRRLDGLAAAMLDEVPGQLDRLADRDDRRLARTCASATAELLPVREHRLLHWDLHYDNVLAGTREPWLAIDPKPLAGEVGFELLPALCNRWDKVVATGDVPRAVRRRFDLMVDVLGLDRQRAAAWTLARVLQTVLWDLADGPTTVHPARAAIARALLSRTA